MSDQQTLKCSVKCQQNGFPVIVGADNGVQIMFSPRLKLNLKSHCMGMVILVWSNFTSIQVDLL